MANPALKVFAEAKSADGGLKAVQEAISELKRHEVLIGIPEDASGRNDAKGTPVNNAELLFIHTNGSPARGIPARPVLEPAIKNDGARVAEMLGKAIDAAVSGDKGGVMPALERAGQYGENIAKAWFANPSNGWAPNAVSTIKRKNKGDASAKTNPLIDTGEMRKSITHVVREG
jgi:hypothetical protein